jgi:hypothetical protein
MRSITTRVFRPRAIGETSEKEMNDDPLYSAVSQNTLSNLFPFLCGPVLSWSPEHIVGRNRSEVTRKEAT